MFLYNFDNFKPKFEVKKGQKFYFLGNMEENHWEFNLHQLVVNAIHAGLQRLGDTPMKENNVPIVPNPCI